MTTYVLVHGGFTDSAYWADTAALLEKSGHRVLLPELPSTGPDPSALGGMADDVAEVRASVGRAVEPVVLVGHSYAGMVITELADHPAVARRVYLGAFWPERGASLMDILAAGPLPAWIVPTADGSALRVTPDVELAWANLCADLEPDRVPQWHRDLLYSSGSGAATPVSAPDPTHPVTYVVLDRDRVIPPATQVELAARADRVEHLPTAHVPQLSDPDALAAVLLTCD